MCQQARKEILDTELELFNKEHSGEDTTALKLKLSELTKQVCVSLCPQKLTLVCKSNDKNKTGLAVKTLKI